MCKSNWPEAFGIGAVAVGLTVVLTPWERLGPLNWGAVSAIGTLLAVVVAIFVPMVERIGRDRASRKESVVLDWANASDVLLCIEQLRNFLSAGKSLVAPTIAEVDRIILKLESVSSKNRDPIGAAVIARCLEEAAIIRRYVHEAEHNVSMRSIHHMQLSSRYRESKILTDHGRTWMNQVLARADRLQVPLMRR